MSPSLSFLKGVAKLKNLQDDVSYILDCAAEAWWYPKMWEKLRFFNEVWLVVQGKFIQYHQDIDNATGEGFKSIWIEKPQVGNQGSEKKGWSETYVLALLD